MLAKYWKKIALLITIIAILFNITAKLVSKVSFKDEINSTVDYEKVIEDTDKNK